MQGKIFEDYSSYDDCIPPGVLLPKINISAAQYKFFNCDESATNFEFLQNLCEFGAKEKSIDLKKPEYKKRLRYELRILEKLGFIDYILLNWDILN